MSIRKTKAGTYEVRWREGHQHRARTFDRKIDAVQFEASMKVAGESELRPSTSSLGDEFAITFSEFTEVWLRNYGAVHKTEGALKNDRQIMRDYLVPAWGPKPLTSVTKRDIANLQGKLVAEGRIKPKTINNIVGLAHTIFNVAVQWEYLRVNPAESVPQIKVPEQDYELWTFDERDKFLRWARANDPELHDIIATAVYTGLRRGEMEALKRDCIDLERRFIIVKRSYCSKTRRINEYTKGKKIRRVPMNDVVFRIMQERAFLSMDSLVLPADYGHIVQEWFGPAEYDAGVSEITFHDLRHTFASHLAMMGVSVFDIQKLMGHADIKTTMRYMHLAPDHLAGVTDVLLGKKERKMPGSLDSRLETQAPPAFEKLYVKCT
jgi:integrase